MLPFLVAQALPEPSILDLGVIGSQAIANKRYDLLVVVALVGLVALARWGGAKAWPWLGTPRGGALLVALGGTGGLLLAALKAGQPLTVDLVLACFLTSASAAGLWSMGKNVAKKPVPAPSLQERCTPIEIANGTCKP